MARPREFDEERALRGAMHLFWKKGFDAASIPDLLNATGLSRSSLYHTFGYKQSLFDSAIRLYLRENTARGIGALRDADTLKSGLTRFFGAQIDSCRFFCSHSAGRFGPPARVVVSRGKRRSVKSLLPSLDPSPSRFRSSL